MTQAEAQKALADGFVLDDSYSSARPLEGDPTEWANNPLRSMEGPQKAEPLQNWIVLREGQTKGLIGKYFHSYTDNGLVDWQGVIIDTDRDDVIVQLFEWFGGSPGIQKLVPRATVYEWNLYEDEAAMKAAYDNQNQL